MSASIPTRTAVRLLSLLLVLLLAMALPASTQAHAELGSSLPADGATVDAPFAGPIELTFTEDLAADSAAELFDGAGQVAASSTVDGAVISLTPDAPLAEGEYEVRWTAIADDGHIERGRIPFLVLAAATPEPTASPTPSPTPDVAASPSAAPTPDASADPAATPSSAPVATAAASPNSSGSGTDTSGADVLLPILVGALAVGAVAVYLLRRRDSGSGAS